MGNLTAYHMHVLQIKAPTIKFPIFSSIINWGEGWDLTGWRACPMGGAFELCKIQIPTYSPTLPGWGVVGHNIDRCIIYACQQAKCLAPLSSRTYFCGQTIDRIVIYVLPDSLDHSERTCLVCTLDHGNCSQNT